MSKSKSFMTDTGTQYRLLNGVYHREDGPALIFGDGEQRWIINGKLHREDGPAVIIANGSYVWWYLNGVRYEFIKWCKETNKTDEEIAILKLEYA